MNESPREKYLNKVFGKEGRKSRDAKQKKALEYAHKIRQFEIDLFWKRSAYFWVFIAFALAGYGGLIKLQITCSVDCDLKLLKLAFIILSSIGFILSFLWWLANRGSRFWQEVWEKNIDYLEDEITGQLYKTIVYKKSSDKLFRLVSAFPFSVSKISTSVSLLSVGAWGSLLLFNLHQLLQFWVAFGLVLVVLFIMMWLSRKYLKSSFFTKTLEEKRIELSNDKYLYIRSLDD